MMPYRFRQNAGPNAGVNASPNASAGAASRSLIEFWYVSYLLLGVATYGLAVILMPLIVAAAGHRPFRIGAVIAIQNFGLLSGPVWGRIMDRFGRHRLVLLSGCFLIASGFAGLSFLTSLPSLFASACLIGVGTAAATTATIVFVVGLTPQAEWSDRIGYLQLFNSTGTTIGLAFAGLLPVHGGAVAGAVCAVASAILARMTLPASVSQHAAPAAPRPQAPRPQAPQAPGPQAPGPGASRPRGTSQLRVLLTCWFLLAVGTSCFSAPYPIIMHRVFDTGVRLSSSIVSFATLAGLPLYAVSGLLIRRFGSSLVFAGGIVCRAASLLGIGWLSLADPTGHRALLFVLVGAFQTSWPVISVSVNDRLFRISPLGRGLSTGLFTFVGALASAAGALAGGAIADRAGYAAIAGVAALFSALALLLATRMPRIRQHPPRSCLCENLAD